MIAHEQYSFGRSKSEDSQAYYRVILEEAKAQPTKRYQDILEQRSQWNNKTLQERDGLQMGQPRKYTIPAGRYPAGQWPGEIIESSSYPNGNQGDDLIGLNRDPSRYVVKSTGCGPQDYELKTEAPKSDVNGIWVSEHILELNTIGRFMAASLGGSLAGPDASTSTNVPPFWLTIPNMHEVEMFAHRFTEWDSHAALTPADSCLVQLGSMQKLQGLVVCDSTLNMMKTKIYKLQNPVGDATWSSYAIFATTTSLQRALAYIQTIMAVFDHYDDTNVKTRHARAYRDVLAEMAKFEQSYQNQYNRNIHGQWQQRWKEFMKSHFMRVETHTRMWLQTKLIDLYRTWDTALRGCTLVPDSLWCSYTMEAVYLIESHYIAIEGGQKVVFDNAIFTDLT